MSEIESQVKAPKTENPAQENQPAHTAPGELRNP